MTLKQIKLPKIQSILIAIVLLSCTLLISCSQEKCEDMLSNSYAFRVELLDEYDDIIDVRYCDNYYNLYGDSLTYFTYAECDRGKIGRVTFTSRNFIIYPL